MKNFLSRNSNIYINKLGDRGYNIINSYDGKALKVTIDNNLLNENFNILLLKKGIKVISEEGNSIYFQKTSFLQSDSGLAYSINGSKPDWPNLTVLEEIEGNWYYYSGG